MVMIERNLNPGIDREVLANEIFYFVLENRRVMAIKCIKSSFDGCGIKEAKDYVDRFLSPSVYPWGVTNTNEILLEAATKIRNDIRGDDVPKMEESEVLENHCDRCMVLETNKTHLKTLCVEFPETALYQFGACVYCVWNRNLKKKDCFSPFPIWTAE